MSTSVPSSQDDKLLQLTLSKLEYEKARADKAEARELQLVEQRKEALAAKEEWKALYLEERKRSNLLDLANTQLLSANRDLNIAVSKLKENDAISKAYIASLETSVKKLKVQRFVWAGITFTAGFTGGYVANRF